MKKDVLNDDDFDGNDDHIDALKDEVRSLRATLGALVSDVQGMRCGLPEFETPDWTARQEGGLFGPFEDNATDPQSGEVIINWPNLGITLAEAQAVLGRSGK